jgi:hypothetical protein
MGSGRGKYLISGGIVLERPLEMGLLWLFWRQKGLYCNESMASA